MISKIYNKIEKIIFSFFRKDVEELVKKNNYPECVVDLMEEYLAQDSHIRLGQYFVNNYVKYSWPELFYEYDDRVALDYIVTYLKNHQYITTLPQKIR